MTLQCIASLPLGDGQQISIGYDGSRAWITFKAESGVCFDAEISAEDARKLSDLFAIIALAIRRTQGPPP